MANKFALLLFVFVLSACSFTREDGDQWVMVLPHGNEKAATNVETALPKGSTLKVELPESPSYLETQRVAVQRPDGALDYYAGARWADILPLHFQQALVASLQGAGIYRQVVADDVAAPAKYRLLIQMQEFTIAHARGSAAEAHLRITYALQKDRRDVAHGTAMGQAVLTNESRPGIQAGYNQAYQDLVGDLIRQIRPYH